MTTAKAEKHLRYAKEYLKSLREEYVEVMRNPNWRMLDRDSVAGNNAYRNRLEGIRIEMEEAKSRIAKFERILL